MSQRDQRELLNGSTPGETWSSRPSDPTAVQRELFTGFGNGLARAFEMAATPAIFVVLGLFVDGKLGTRPLFTIALGLLAVVGMFVRTWYAYDSEMKAHEVNQPWSRSGAGS